MKAMRFLISFLILLSAAQAPAGEDAATRAMKLYEKRHFAEAASMLRTSLPSLDPARQAAAQLTLGMSYLRNADLHERLYRQSLAVHLEYLRKIAAGHGKNRSRFANLYLAETLLEARQVRSGHTLSRYIRPGGRCGPSSQSDSGCR